MSTPLDAIDPASLASAWEELHTSGTACPTVAQAVQVRIGPFLDAFSARFLGEKGVRGAFKLLLGVNGEGKTHLLLCIQQQARERGHAVALLDAKTSAAGDSAFDFAREVLRRIEPPATEEGDSDDLRIVRLVKVSVQQKRAAAEAAGAVADEVVSLWGSGFRGKDLHPFGLGDAVADCIDAAIRQNDAEMRAAAARISFEGVKLSRKDAQVSGAALLRSIPRLVTLLGFKPLVLLVDEAETAVERKGSAARREFLKFLRFLNDHVARGAADGAGALVVIACTSDFWPDQFSEYEALRQRLSDPGHDTLAERDGLSPNARIRLNKWWVRETFRGNREEYEELGRALVDVAARVNRAVNAEVQLRNSVQLAAVASSDRVKREIKRIYVKALCQLVETQAVDEKQQVISPAEAERLLDSALKDIRRRDEE
jgi:bacteriophage exclusion system BrxC/D-like protein